VRNILLFVLVVVCPLAFMVLVSKGADRAAEWSRESCLAKGGFPVSKGPRSYDYHCFKTNPLLTE
jgi:hypothetical protein